MSKVNLLDVAIYIWIILLCVSYLGDRTNAIIFTGIMLIANLMWKLFYILENKSR